MMKKLVVGVAERSYPIVIGEGLLEKLDEFLAGKGGKRAAVISNQIVAPLYMGKVLESISRSGRDTIALTLPDGENTKSWETLNQIYDWLLSERCDRTTTIVALGGGVIGDLAGFAAATYQRGVPFIQIPTTLLSQVDSSVGGKTGINHPLGKNMIGAFWQPMLVVADTTTLSTLPDRELSAGMAEVIKYGLIRDLSFLEWLEMSMDRLMARDPVALATAIERSCANKAEVVVADEFERAKEGGRALLNLGHTFGHAIETGVGYGSWLHGEAVAAGTMMAVELSRRLGWLSDSDVKRIENLYKLARLPVKGPALGADRYLDLMEHDKKIQAGRLRLVLLRAIGQAVTWADAPESDIRAAIEACCA